VIVKAILSKHYALTVKCEACANGFQLVVCRRVFFVFSSFPFSNTFCDDLQ
jgi:hypothetical protein